MKDENETQDEIDPNDRPSKSAVKRELLALQDLGKVLCEMPFDKVKRGPVSEKLLEAIKDYHKARGFGGKKRQMLYVGKVMRDEEAEEIEKWIKGDTIEQKMQVLHMHAAEQWRDQLVADPKSLQALIAAYPAAAQMNLNPLIRSVVQERASTKPPKLYRQLYQTLYALIQGKTGQAETTTNEYPDEDEGEFND